MRTVIILIIVVLIGIVMIVLVKSMFRCCIVAQICRQIRTRYIAKGKIPGNAGKNQSAFAVMSAEFTWKSFNVSTLPKSNNNGMMKWNNSTRTDTLCRAYCSVWVRGACRECPHRYKYLQEPLGGMNAMQAEHNLHLHTTTICPDTDPAFNRLYPIGFWGLFAWDLFFVSSAPSSHAAQLFPIKSDI